MIKEEGPDYYRTELVICQVTDDSVQRLAFLCIDNPPITSYSSRAHNDQYGWILDRSAGSRKSIGDTRMQEQRGTISHCRGTTIMTTCGTVKWSACVCNTDTVSRLHAINTGVSARV